MFCFFFSFWSIVSPFGTTNIFHLSMFFFSLYVSISLYYYNDLCSIVLTMYYLINVFKFNQLTLVFKKINWLQSLQVLNWWHIIKELTIDLLAISISVLDLTYNEPNDYLKNNALQVMRIMMQWTIVLTVVQWTTVLTPWRQGYRVKKLLQT